MISTKTNYITWLNLQWELSLLTFLVQGGCYLWKHPYRTYHRTVMKTQQSCPTYLGILTWSCSTCLYRNRLLNIFSELKMKLLYIQMFQLHKQITLIDNFENEPFRQDDDRVCYPVKVFQVIQDISIAHFLCLFYALKCWVMKPRKANVHATISGFPPGLFDSGQEITAWVPSLDQSLFL